MARRDNAILLPQGDCHGQPTSVSTDDRCRGHRGVRVEGQRPRGGAGGVGTSRRASRCRRGAGRNLLARNPVGVHARPHPHQLQQRQQLSKSDGRPRRAEAVSRLQQPGAGALPRAARTEPRDRAAAARRRVRVRQGRARGHPQLERSAADRAERHRPQARRRSPDDRTGLRPDADDVGSARPARGTSRSSRSTSPSRRPRTICTSASRRRSRRERRCCTSATSPTSRVSTSR